MPPKHHKRRAPRRVRKYHRKGHRAGKMSSNTKVDDKVILRRTIQMTSSTGLTGVGQYVYYAVSPANTNYSNLANVAEFGARAQLYDEYCIKSVKMTFRPLVNTINPANTAAVTTFRSDLFHWVDRDGNTPVSTSVSVIPKLMEYDSLKVRKVTQAFHRTIKCKSFWVNTGSGQNAVAPNSSSIQPWINAGYLQMMGIYGENLPFPTPTTIGDVTYEWNVHFRGKKPVAFGFDATSGSVILTPLTSYVPLAPMNPAAEEPLDETVGAIVVTSVKGDVAHI